MTGIIEYSRRHRGWLFVILLGVAIVAAAAARLWAAPLSTGPDVAQFWAFAQAFRAHGLDFYRYADASGPGFPFQYWAYVYPPAWLLVLAVCLLFVPNAQASSYSVDTAWRLAEKTPIILADLAIGVLIFWAVPGSKARKLLFACLWLFHPTAWYQSAVFGQFDAIAALFVLAALVMFVKEKGWPVFLLAGLAISFKQHALIPLAAMFAGGFRQIRNTSLVRNVLILLAPLAALSLPFALDGNLVPYLKAVLQPAQAPGYQYPIELAFSGTGSLLTYLHDSLGWNTVPIISWTTLLTGVGLLLVVALAYLKRLNPVQAALCAFLVFVALFYRINYQYLVVYIPIALLVAALTPYKLERIYALVLALFPAVWLWLFDVSAWFKYLAPLAPWVTPYLARVGLTHTLEPIAYVAFAVALACLGLAYVVLAFTRWRRWPEQAAPSATSCRP